MVVAGGFFRVVCRGVVCVGLLLFGICLVAGRSLMRLILSRFANKFKMPIPIWGLLVLVFIPLVLFMALIECFVVSDRSVRVESVFDRVQ